MNKDLNSLGNSIVNTSVETEIRFGWFDRGRFVPGTSEKQFKELINMFSGMGWKMGKTKDRVHSRTLSRNQAVRWIEGPEHKYQLKQKLLTIDNPELGYRLAKSKEMELNKSVYNKTNNKSQYVRTRDRITFTQGHLQLDLTYLPEESTNKFQVELEFNGRLGVKEIVTLVSSVIYEEYWYRELVGGFKFAGPLPNTLTKDDFDRKILSKINYSVTDKADGERYLLYINKHGIHAFITRKMEFITIPGVKPTPDFANTMLDGEFIGGTYYAFDLLFQKGKDFRSGDLPKRLDGVYDTLVGLRMPSLRMKNFFVEKGDKVYEYPGNKPVPFKSVYEAAGYVWTNRKKLHYGLDGLIFTPVDKPYFNKEIYKWKDDNTIDFFYKKNKLFLAGPDAKGVYSMIPFEGTDGKGTIGGIKNLIFTDTTASEELRKGIIEKIPANKPQQGIAEFGFRDNTFVLLKMRMDKEFPNGVAASNQSWEAIRKPLTIEDITRGPRFMRDFHSEIKSNLIMKYAPGKVVLDIGSGKGEDIGKYIKAKAKQVVGIDIVEEEYPHPDNFQFYKVSSPIYDVRELVKNTVGQFDMININFAIHYFFENKKLFESLLMNIQKNLKPGGVLVATTLDGKLVYDALKGKSKYSTNTVDFEKGYDNKNSFNKLKFLGQKVSVLVKGTKYFKDAIPEFLVNFQKFIEVMDKWGFSLEETKSFSDLCGDSRWCSKMSNSEKDYSFKNIYFVLRKRG